MAKIRVSRPVEKTAKSGSTYFNQAVLVDQFPHANYTQWISYTKQEYEMPVGVFEADMYLIERENTTPDGKTYKRVEARFSNLRPIQ